MVGKKPMDGRYKSQNSQRCSRGNEAQNRVKFMFIVYVYMRKMKNMDGRRAKLLDFRTNKDLHACIYTTTHTKRVRNIIASSYFNRKLYIKSYFFTIYRVTNEHENVCL